MVVNPNPISFDSGRAVNAWLDRWAGDRLRDSDDWQQVLDLTRDWSDYSPRNQLLLASYRATGPVAGLETWQLVPSRDGVACSVRSGEHALPVRVPVTTGTVEPDPHLGGVRPTAAAVAGWEWRGVFCVEQLVRRPDPTALARPALAVGDDELQGAVVAAARRTLKGPIPDTDDPLAVLTAAVERMPRNSKRAAPTGVLAAEAAQLSLNRVGAAGEMPRFDPGPLEVRERWESLLDVLDADRRVTAVIGRHLGVDLLASPLPRMVIDDDRAVPARRRNRLPRASVEQLPVGRWVEVGPYTRDEWAARGENANGKGAYRRLNATAYLVVVEQGDRASWRFEDTRSKVGAGRLDGGDDVDLVAAKASAIATLVSRYPQLATDMASHPHEVGRAGWETVDGQPGAWRQTHHGRVTSYVIHDDGRFLALVQRGPDRAPEIVGPPVTGRDEAMEAATAAGRRALREVVLEVRVDFDSDLADYASSDAYTRQGLVDRVSPRLATAEQTALESGPDPAQLAELLGAAGVTATTTVTVLHAEGAPATSVAPLLPILGIGPADAIGELHQRWGTSRVDAAELVDATATEMRAAGCAPAEILATRPRDVLTTLPADPGLWELAAGTLAAEHSPEDVAGFLATHAPNPDCFAAGLATAVDDPATGLELAARRGMPAEAIAASSERYGLSPADTATALAAGRVASHTAVAVIHLRCDGDPALTTQIARSQLGLRTETVLAALTSELEPEDQAHVRDQVRTVVALSSDRAALIAAHQPPVPTAPRRVERTETDRLLAALPEPDGGRTGDDREGLIAALPEPHAATEVSLLDALPASDLSL
jgi:hypothetical protein